MKKLMRIFAYEGIALLLFGILSFFFAPEAFIFGLIVLLGGLLMLVTYLVFGGVSLMDRIKSRGARYGTNALVYSLVVFGFVVAANYLGARYDKQWDVTSAKINTLSEKTVNVIDSLAEPVQAYAFFKPGEDEVIDQLLDKYVRASNNRFSYEVVDPDRHPELVTKYEVTQRGQTALVSGTRKTIISGQTEEDVTNALIKISRNRSGAVYFLTGHGEIPLESADERGLLALKKALENENLVVKTLVLEAKGEVPRDAELLVVAGPSKTIPDSVLKAIGSYLEQGGRLFAALDPQTTTGMENLLEEYGVTVNNDIIVDQQMTLTEGATLGIDPVIQDFPKHEITANFDQPVVFPRARSLMVLPHPATDPLQVVPIALTNPGSWGETDFERLFEEGEVTRSMHEIKGPLVVAAAVTRTVETEKSTEENADAPKKQLRLVVTGDSEFLTNKFIQYLYNGVLAMNIVNWLTGQEDLVAIPPRSYKPDQVFLTSRDRQIVFLGSVFLVPQIVLMFGIGLILRRRGYEA